MKKIYIVTLFSIIIFTGCNKIDKIIKNQKIIISLCKNKELCLRGNTIVYLVTSNNGLRNEYCFSENNSVNPPIITLSWDSIQFIPDNVIGVIPDSTEKYKTDICNYVEKLSKTMDSLYIREFSSIKYKNNSNIELTLYLKNGDILEYRPESSEDIKGYKNIENGWYLYNP
ncbi:MAG: hypothetical protein LBS69_03175 [Prevotellaceae bacterium]|jgi:hypothetical protein|nr:hypothetical protein [Prevotellaceae bacterium]